MGTNYYAVQPPCDACGRPETTWHITKSLRTFEAHRESEYRTTPWGDICSVADWRAVLLGERGAPTVFVRDEYGKTHDAAEFLDRVAAVLPEHRRQQYDWMVEHAGRGAWSGMDMSRDFLDAEGFSIYAGEFS